MVLVKGLTSTKKMDKQMVKEAINFYTLLSANGFRYLTMDDNGEQHAFIRKPLRHKYCDKNMYYWDALGVHEDAFYITEIYDFGYAKQCTCTLIEDIIEELTKAFENDGKTYYV